MSSRDENAADESVNQPVSRKLTRVLCVVLNVVVTQPNVKLWKIEAFPFRKSNRRA